MNQEKTKLKHDGDVEISHVLGVIRRWNRTETYPWMKRKIINYLAPRLAAGISVAALTLHAFWAHSSGCSVNFQRGGAIVTLIAAALYAVVEWHDPKTLHLSGGPVTKLTFSNPYLTLPLLATLGTVVWGYGDLITWFGTACGAQAS